MKTKILYTALTLTREGANKKGKGRKELTQTDATEGREQ